MSNLFSGRALGGSAPALTGSTTSPVRCIFGNIGQVPSSANHRTRPSTFFTEHDVGLPFVRLDGSSPSVNHPPGAPRRSPPNPSLLALEPRRLTPLRHNFHPGGRCAVWIANRRHLLKLRFNQRFPIRVCTNGLNFHRETPFSHSSRLLYIFRINPPSAGSGSEGVWQDSTPTVPDVVHPPGYSPRNGSERGQCQSL